MNEITVRQGSRRIDVSASVVVVLHDEFPTSHVQNAVVVRAGADSAGVLAGLDLLVAEGRHPYVDLRIEDDCALADRIHDALVAREEPRKQRDHGPLP